MKQRGLSIGFQSSFFFAVMLFACVRAPASTIAPMTTAQMADYAAQVVTGRVSSVRSYWADRPRRIESEVTLDTVTYLKGAPRQASTTYRLIVPGGKIGEKQMRLCCAPQFKVGQQWLLFVLPEYKTFPVVGLYRGAFRMTQDAEGVVRVLSSDGSAVTGIDNAGFIRIAGGELDPHSRLRGAAGADLRIGVAADLQSMPISLQDFLAELQPILDASRNHGLTGPAGRRIPTVYTPIGLSPSAIDGHNRESAPIIGRADRAMLMVKRKRLAPARSTRQSGDRQ